MGKIDSLKMRFYPIFVIVALFAMVACKSDDTLVKVSDHWNLDNFELESLEIDYESQPIDIQARSCASCHWCHNNCADCVPCIGAWLVPACVVCLPCTGCELCLLCPAPAAAPTPAPGVVAVHNQYYGSAHARAGSAWLFAFIAILSY